MDIQRVKDAFGHCGGISDSMARAVAEAATTVGQRPGRTEEGVVAQMVAYVSCDAAWDKLMKSRYHLAEAIAPEPLPSSGSLLGGVVAQMVASAPAAEARAKWQEKINQAAEA